jgi:hypothetical protein
METNSEGMASESRFAEVVFRANHADSERLTEHLVNCDQRFMPRLSNRVDIAKYAAKIRLSKPMSKEG